MQDIDGCLEIFEEFKQKISDGLLPKQAEIYRKKNFYNPIHQLPVEIFTEILLLTVGQQDDWNGHHLQTLAQVSTLWRNTVRSTSLFWQHLSSEDSDQIQEHVLRANPTGPLKIICTADADLLDEPMLHLAIPHSSRWQSVLFSTSDSDAFPECLSAPTPRLSDLLVYLHSDEPDVQPQIILSEGRHLRNVDLDGVRICWDSDRLTRLEALSLQELRGSLPTISQLYTILSSSPQLWCLILSQWSLEDEPHVHDHSTGARDTQLISLPSLSNLRLMCIPPHISDFLLSVLDCPSRLRVDVDDALTTSSSNFIPNILRSSLPNAPRVTLRFSARLGTVTVQTEPHVHPLNNWIHNHADHKPGCCITMRRSAPSEDCRKLALWLADIQLPPTKLESGMIALPPKPCHSQSNSSIPYPHSTHWNSVVDPTQVPSLGIWQYLRKATARGPAQV